MARFEEDPPRSRLHLSKGIHVVVPRERFPVNHLVICNAEDKRSIFVIPRGDVVYIGTTDTSYHGDRPLWPEIGADDVRYLLSPMARYFDIAPLAEADVVAAWAGVRPLIAQEGKDPKEMSRRTRSPPALGDDLDRRREAHRLPTDGRGRRRRGRPTAGAAAACRPRARARPRGALTDVGPDEPPRGLTARLRRLYGSEATEVLALDATPLVAGAPVVAGEVDWAIEVEAATTLVDVVYRRTRVAWFVPGHRRELAAAMASRMATRLDWDAARTADELAAVDRLFAEELSFRAADPDRTTDGGRP
ncbi:MAG: glycerol-3-phosphate dehydrogenase C-terminal domain-containing protein [Acidimicrobiales bacterium]